VNRRASSRRFRAYGAAAREPDGPGGGAPAAAAPPPWIYSALALHVRSPDTMPDTSRVAR